MYAKKRVGIGKENKVPEKGIRSWEKGLRTRM